MRWLILGRFGKRSFRGCSGIPYRSLELVNSGRPRLARLVIAGSRVVCLLDLVAALRALDCVACGLGRSPVAPTLLEELLSVGIGGGAGLQTVVQDIALALSSRARCLHELHGLVDLRLQRRGLRLFLLLPPGGLRLFRLLLLGGFLRLLLFLTSARRLDQDIDHAAPGARRLLPFRDHLGLCLPAIDDLVVLLGGAERAKFAVEAAGSHAGVKIL